MVMAVIEAEAGDYEDAVERLEYLLSIPSIASVEMLRAAPLPEEMKTHPRFLALLARGDKVF